MSGLIEIIAAHPIAWSLSLWPISAILIRAIEVYFAPRLLDRLKLGLKVVDVKYNELSRRVSELEKRK